MATFIFAKQDDPETLEGAAARIRRALEDAFARLVPVAEGRPVYVTLSGGLDSTSIAALARAHLGSVVGLTFHLDDGAGVERAGDDLYFARKVADALGIELVVVRQSPDALMEGLDDVLVYGQDWRDFNVHCGLVNLALAKALAERHVDADHRPLILTGDTANELVADYTPVEYQGRAYYALPRMDVARLRRFLVAGLDSGDREVGIFNAFGLDTVQPYALCAEAYARVPGRFVASEGAKQRLIRQAMGDRIPAFIYDRPKVRAQVGSSEEVGGTLAALVDRGMDSGALAERFSALFGLDQRGLRSLVRAGYYRFSTVYPEVSS